MRTKNLSKALLLLLAASAPACIGTGDSLQEEEDMEEVGEAQQAALLPLCTTELSVFWGAVNDLAGAIPGASNLFKFYNALSKVGQRVGCTSGMENLTKQMEAIAHKTVDQALLNQVKAKSTAITNLYLSDPSPDKIVQEALALDIAAEEASAATLSFEVLPTLSALGLLKLGIHQSLVQEALRQEPTASATASSEYYRQVVKMLNALSDTETRLNGQVTKLDAHLALYSSHVETVSDNGDLPSHDSIGIVDFPDGTDYPHSITSSEANPFWVDCSGSYNGCAWAREQAKTGGEQRREQKKLEARNKILDSNYKTMRSHLTSIRTALIAQLNQLNLAHKKTASQSSGSGSSAAVDGDRATSATVATGNPNPWWKVDLGRVQSIDTVTFKTSITTGQFTVQILGADNSTVVHQKIVDASSSSEAIAIMRAAPITTSAAKKGRYVKILRSSGGGSLNLADVYVLGANLARAMPATQSSTAGSGAAGRAVDGSIDGNYGNNSVSHTSSQSGASWTVDLGESHPVRHVVLYNRTDCCSDRLSNFKVVLMDDSNNVIATKTYAGTAGTAPLKFEFGANPWGQKIKIQLNGTNYLHLAEVEVFRSADPQ